MPCSLAALLWPKRRPLIATFGAQVTFVRSFDFFANLASSKHELCQRSFSLSLSAPHRRRRRRLHWLRREERRRAHLMDLCHMNWPLLSSLHAMRAVICASHAEAAVGALRGGCLRKARYQSSLKEASGDLCPLSLLLLLLLLFVFFLVCYDC